MLAWILMDESMETEDPLPPVPVSAPELLDPGVAERHWPTKPRP